LVKQARGGKANPTPSGGGGSKPRYSASRCFRQARRTLYAAHGV